jgi:APA family basic amino acid/polyamine antiporter
MTITTLPRWTPLLFVLAAGVLVLNTVILQPGRALVGAALIMLGAPAFWYWRGKRNLASQETLAG